MRKVSSSKGSDGHTLAVTAEGEVFSWGDGDYGKLGHGNSATQKYPKIIQGPLLGKVRKFVFYMQKLLLFVCLDVTVFVCLIEIISLSSFDSDL